MKKSLIVILVIIATLFIVLLFLRKENINTKIKIGAILPLTGDAAVAGKNTKLGIDLAVQIINNEGGINGDSLFVIYEDTKGMPKYGVSAVYKLLDVDKVKYIIDNSISSVTLAVAPIIDLNNVVLLATGASSPEITNSGKNIFRIWNSDFEEAVVMSNFVRDSIKEKNILILHVNNDYGIGLKNAFINNMDTSFTFKVKSFPNGTTEFSAYINEIKRFKLIYIIAYSEDSKRIIKKLKELGFDGTILGTSVMLDPTVQKSISDNGFIAYYPQPEVQDSTNRNYLEFYKQYRKRYKTDPVVLSDVGYDAVMLFYESVKNSDDNIYQNIIGTFNQKMEFYGASGKIVFDQNGDVHKKIIINKI